MAQFRNRMLTVCGALHRVTDVESAAFFLTTGTRTPDPERRTWAWAGAAVPPEFEHRVELGHLRGHRPVPH